MHHDVGSLETIIDEIGSLVEEFAEVKGLMVFSGNVKEVRHIGSGVSKVHTFARGKNCLDLMFWIKGKLLRRVLRFWAASRFPMKRPPQPFTGSMMQE